MFCWYKFVCKSTEYTKAEAIQLIHDGQLTVNGAAIMNEAAQVHENNTIMLHGECLKA